MLSFVFIFTATAPLLDSFLHIKYQLRVRIEKTGIDNLIGVITVKTLSLSALVVAAHSC